MATNHIPVLRSAGLSIARLVAGVPRHEHPRASAPPSSDNRPPPDIRSPHEIFRARQNAGGSDGNNDGDAFDRARRGAAHGGTRASRRVHRQVERGGRHDAERAEPGRPLRRPPHLFGWDAESKRYTYDSFNSLGQRASFTGSVAGDTWTWSAERTAGGTRLLMRMVQHFTADGKLTWKIETSTDGTHWATAVTGQAKRAP